MRGWRRNRKQGQSTKNKIKKEREKVYLRGGKGNGGKVNETSV